jgi:hypothetical protein
MKAELDAKQLANELTITVEIKRHKEWTLRLWVAAKLIKLAAWIAWVGVEINNDGAAFCNWMIERNRYRVMILKLLDGAPDTKIPQETRDSAYDLLDEYFEG